MAFRRFRRRTSFKRPRARFDMQSVKVCFGQIQGSSVTDSALFTCDNPLIVATPIVSPQGELTNANRALLEGGMHFQLEYSVNQVSTSTEGNDQLVVRQLHIWEAICVIPNANPIDTTATPAYLPLLSNPGTNGDHDVDTLWKRLSVLPIFDDSAQFGGGTTGIPLQFANQRFNMPSFTTTSWGPQVMKARRSLKENENLYLVQACVLDFGFVAESSWEFEVTFDFYARNAVRVL